MKFPSPTLFDSPLSSSQNQPPHWGILYQTHFKRVNGGGSDFKSSKFLNLRSPITSKYPPFHPSPSPSLFNEKHAFDINFLRKEPLYSKLKYSRTQSFDIVSGGVALLLTSFLGYLSTEKVGFELIDSGDFLFLIVYLMIVLFEIKITLKLYSDSHGQ